MASKYSANKDNDSYIGQPFTETSFGLLFLDRAMNLLQADLGMAVKIRSIRSEVETELIMKSIRSGKWVVE